MQANVCNNCSFNLDTSGCLCRGNAAGDIAIAGQNETATTAESEAWAKEHTQIYQDINA